MVVAPAPHSRPIQFIDARDAAKFAVHAGVSELSGIYNVTGPEMPFGAVLNEAIRISQSGAELVWVSEQKLKDVQIEAWSEMPLMAPPVPSFRYLMQVDTGKAQASGLTTRPPAETFGTGSAGIASIANVP